MTEQLRHGLRPMAGRDPHEDGRASTPLELMFDLTFVIAFGAASNELAHYAAEGHWAAGLGGFAFATFAVSWAWINYSWFASAFDTDDWVFRLLTMVQMVGVLILALGLPRMFASLDHGDHVDNSVMVLGYVVMRVPMVFQWLRAARQNPDRRGACLSNVVCLVISQAMWVGLLLAHTGIGATFGLIVVPLAVELAGPLLAENRWGGIPWHAHHIAERYGLMVIIALGEGLLGTTAALGALVGDGGPGWSVEVGVLGLAGVAMTFGMWWVYFVTPSGPILHAHRERSFGFGYGQIALFGATVAVGAGLHVAAYFLGGRTEVGEVAVLLTVAVPLGLYVLGIFLLYAQLSRTLDPFHLLLLAVTGAVLVASVVLALAGGSLVWCLAVLSLSPWVAVVGYETRGHRHNAEVLAAL